MKITRNLLRRISVGGCILKTQTDYLGVQYGRGKFAQKLIGRELLPGELDDLIQLKNEHISKKIEKQKSDFKNKTKVKQSKDSTKISISKTDMFKITFVKVTKKISFEQQYKHPNWQKIRNVILYRDSYKCQKCGDTHSQLHVHHLKYLKDKFVWEVPISWLITLCYVCHSKEHKHMGKQNKKKIKTKKKKNNLLEYKSSSIGYVPKI